MLSGHVHRFVKRTECLLGPIGRAFSLGGRTHWEPWSLFSPHVVLGCYRFARERRGGARQGRSSVVSALPPRPDSTLSFHSQGPTQGSPACAAPNGPVVVYTPHGNPFRHPIPHGRATVA
uniref:Uncharacterized protein n=1 Tax=Ananas comosus var. bracteatus TaxID=296719 RepID=A0A6V7PPY3_ANACO|nr:unnamed protein product [Ananas comosus var. bracteatus]